MSKLDKLLKERDILKNQYSESIDNDNKINKYRISDRTHDLREKLFIHNRLIKHEQGELLSDIELEVLDIDLN
jgi:hypothetical protein